MILFAIPSTLKYLFLTFSDVFLSESPKVPGLKFDRDTSSFWYKPNITRNDGRFSPFWHFL